MADAISRQAFSDLIGSIYDCALDPFRWERTLADIKDALDCHGITLTSGGIGQVMIGMVAAALAATTEAGTNRAKLENLIHRIFDSAPLDIEIKDRFGQPVVPRECYLVCLFAIDEAIERIKDGTITGYVYNPKAAALVQSLKPLTRRQPSWAFRYHAVRGADRPRRVRPPAAVARQCVGRPQESQDSLFGACPPRTAAQGQNASVSPQWLLRPDVQRAAPHEEVQLGHRIEARAAVPVIWIMPGLILVGPHPNSW